MLKSLLAGLAISVTASSVYSQPVWTAGVRTVSPWYKTAVAAHPDGGLAITWAAASGINAGSEWQVPYPSHYKSEIYGAFSSDSGSTWSDPIRLSDPTLYSSQPDICAGSVPGNFYVTWSSGDAFSGYRHHFAHTTDFGDTWTSSSRVQAMTERGQGILYPDIELSNGNPVVTYTAVNQDLPERPLWFYASSLDIPSNGWSEPTSIARQGAKISMTNPLAVGGSTAMIAGCVRTAAASTTPTIFISRSQDNGASWSPPLFMSVYPNLYSQTPTVASGGNGTWVMMYFGNNQASQPWEFSGRPYFQVSRDDGLTWTDPALMNGGISASTADPIGVASNGDGYWVAVSRSNYSYSSDNGASWSEWASAPPGLLTAAQLDSLTYLGNNKWGVLSAQYTAPAGLYLRILNWPAASVQDWTIY